MKLIGGIIILIGITYAIVCIILAALHARDIKRALKLGRKHLLQEQLDIAVENEEFEEAAIIKKELDKLG